MSHSSPHRPEANRGWLDIAILFFFLTLLVLLLVFLVANPDVVT